MAKYITNMGKPESRANTMKRVFDAYKQKIILQIQTFTKLNT